MRMQKTVYMIRSKSTGLFSPGGTGVHWRGEHLPKFTKNGKAWSHRGHILNHLAQFYSTVYDSAYHRRGTKCLIPDDWEVVEIEVTPVVTKVHAAKAFYESTGKKRGTVE